MMYRLLVLTLLALMLLGAHTAASLLARHLGPNLIEASGAGEARAAGALVLVLDRRNWVFLHAQYWRVRIVLGIFPSNYWRVPECGVFLPHNTVGTGVAG